MKLAIINGPNLNLVGSREKDVYGERDFSSFLDSLREKFPAVTFDYFQSNIEGELIDRIHACAGFDGIILNAGGYTHTSVAIADAVAAVKAPVIEVHISNIFSREDYRHTSYLGAKASGVIAGFGLKSYELAVTHFLS
jgi:3-dehydroquinate dehydratase II